MFESPEPRNSSHFPIPKGNSPYALAKRAEYLTRDRTLAKSLYWEAIRIGERMESAVKDLASLLHQEGNTQAACDLLLRYRSIFADQLKYQNLLNDLQEKLIPAGNCLNKHLKLSPMTEYDSPPYILTLFNDPSRILDIQMTYMANERCGILTFPSHSAARKTLSTFTKWDRHRAEWLNVHGEVVGLAGESKRRKNQVKTTAVEASRVPSADLETALQLLGRELMAELSFELNVAAPPFVPNGCQQPTGSSQLNNPVH